MPRIRDCQFLPVGRWIIMETPPRTRRRPVSCSLSAGPKGSGLAMIFECLSSVLAGNPLLSLAIPRMLAGEGRYHAQNGIVAAIDIGAFTDPDVFRTNVDALIDAEKSLPRADPRAEILVPGERGNRTYDKRAANGVPLPPGTIEKLHQVAHILGVPFPDNA